MRCRIVDWRGERRTIDLSQALRPVSSGASGRLEDVESQAQLNAECIGRLAALLVERRILTLAEAETVCDIYPPLKIEDDTP